MPAGRRARGKTTRDWSLLWGNAAGRFADCRRPLMLQATAASPAFEAQVRSPGRVRHTAGEVQAAGRASTRIAQSRKCDQDRAYGSKVLARIYGIKRELGMLRRVVWPLREVVDTLARSEDPRRPRRCGTRAAAVATCSTSPVP